MAEQNETFGEKSKMINMAMKYTSGDMEKAKAMVAGQYQDIIVVKGKFFVPEIDQSGMFLAFFNFINEYIANITSVISVNSGIFERVRVFDDWKSLYKDLLVYEAEESSIDSLDFTNFLLDSFIGYDVFPDVNENNLDVLTKTVNEIISKSYNIKNIQCQIELETTSSLILLSVGVNIDIPDTGDKGSGDDKKGEILEEDDRITKIENEADYIIEGKAVIAPVKGKYINDISIGDKIKVFLPAGDMVSEKILKVLNAFDSDGTRLAINGRVKAKIPLEKSGYIIYALVAKGVLAKIVEEENIKMMIDKPVDELAQASMLDNKLIYLMAIIVGFIILAGIILIQLL